MAEGKPEQRGAQNGGTLYQAAASFSARSGVGVAGSAVTTAATGAFAGTGTLQGTSITETSAAGNIRAAEAIDLQDTITAEVVRRGLAPDWQSQRSALLAQIEQASVLCYSATELLGAVKTTALRSGDNAGPLRDAAVDAASVMIGTVAASLDSLHEQLRAEQPNAKAVDLAGHALTLVGWGWKQFAGGVLHAAGSDAYHYLRDHHAELLHQLEALMGHVFHLAPAVHTLLV